jgi:hypothetical protein
MPTFLTDKLVFIHVPKTGGTWITEALASTGVLLMPPDPLGDQPYSEHGHASLSDLDVGNRFTVAFVRHPLDWWRSYWGHRMRSGWINESGLDSEIASDDFNDFVERVLKYRPGQFDELVRRFVGSPAQVDYVGRFEHLLEDTCTALRLSGQRVPLARILSHPRANANDYGRFPAAYRPDLAARLSEAEHQTIERYYPDEPTPAHLLEGDACEWRPTGLVEAPALPRGELQRISDRMHGLERALERFGRAEEDLERSLEQTSAELGRTANALEALRGSRVVRYTRPLRIAYYHAR